VHVFSIDERLKGIPAVKEQVVQLHQSLNQPHLAVPGRKAGPATADVLGLRGPQGCAVFVYLYLGESGECAVYVPSSGTLPVDRYAELEVAALGFVESMGFIMDNVNFRARSSEEQEDLIRRLPVFRREPPQATAPPPTHAVAEAPTKPDAAGVAKVGSRGISHAALGRLLGSFGLLGLLGLAGSAALGCAHVTEKARQESELRAELAAQNLLKNPQEAFREAEAALVLDPSNADAWLVKGLLLHHSFGRPDEALAAYQRAVSLKEPFSEAHTNLGTLYVDQKRYDDAIREFEIALNDVLYAAPFIAHANMGWAYFRKGNTKDAIDQLKASLTLNPKFCLGHAQLGQVYEAQGNDGEACKYFARYREHCPDTADAWRRDGVCLAKLGKTDDAVRMLGTCVEKAKEDEVKEQCKALKEQLSK
jgi:type IV pilus assembly protein PilF